MVRTPIINIERLKELLIGIGISTYHLEGVALADGEI
jgi:hypothetical protein